MDTVQIEITDACVFRCGNCTRFCGSKKPFYMEMDYYRRAVDSMVGYPNMVGIMGGEPLLHPQFAEICDYALATLGKKHLGLWSTFPAGYEHHRDTICRTFDYIFLNDHSRGDIFHSPILVSSDHVFRNDPENPLRWQLINDCWVQNTWSASINPKGAFFCEVAASLSMLFDGPAGWPVEPGWWRRMPWQYGEQIEWACRRCGCAMPLQRRSSQDERDDVSPDNLIQLGLVKSKKVAAGDVVVHEAPQLVSKGELAYHQAYKDTAWRQTVAAKYGIFLEVTDRGFWRPHLQKCISAASRPSAFAEMQAKYQ
jgi:hypothetical protein